MKMTMTGTGDSILIQGYQEGGYPGFDRVHDFLARGQARFGNLEVCITDWDTYCSAYCGGTWLSAEPRMLQQILGFGFNFLGFANNHAMDLGPDGLLETLRHVKATGTAVAGSGKDLGEASQPVYRDLAGGRVAFIAVNACGDEPGNAGWASRYLPGRPGFNALRTAPQYYVTQEHLDQVKTAAAATKINGQADISRRNGFAPPLPEGVAAFGNVRFRLSPTGEEYKDFSYNKSDAKRILAAIEDARWIADYVVVMLHSHQIKGDDMSEPARFCESFCREMIDAGADAVFGGGTHQFKPIELYHGKPIFYSLGNFCFQSNTVLHQPQDMLDRFNLPDMSDVQCLNARNKNWTVGLHTQYYNFRSAIPYLEFEDGKLVKLELMPVELGFEKPRTFKGVPYPANEKQTQEIFTLLQTLSEPYGTEMQLRDDGIIEIHVEGGHES